MAQKMLYMELINARFGALTSMKYLEPTEVLSTHRASRVGHHPWVDTRHSLSCKEGEHEAKCSFNTFEFVGNFEPGHNALTTIAGPL